MTNIPIHGLPPLPSRFPTTAVAHGLPAAPINCRVCGYLKDDPQNARAFERAAVQILLDPLEPAAAPDGTPSAPLIDLCARHGLSPQHALRHVLTCLASPDAHLPQGAATVFASEIVAGLNHTLASARGVLDGLRNTTNDGRGSVAIANAYTALARTYAAVLDSVAAQAERERQAERIAALEDRQRQHQQRPMGAGTSASTNVVSLNQPRRRTVGDLIEARAVSPRPTETAPEIDPLP